MDKVKIYRVEGFCGQGAYRTYAKDCCTLAQLLTNGEDRCIHPTPCEDKELSHIWSKLDMTDSREDYYFGFESIESYKQWFYCEEGREEAAREEYGYLMVYEIDKKYLHIGEKQVIFLMEEASVIDRLSLNFGD